MLTFIFRGKRRDIGWEPSLGEDEKLSLIFHTKEFSSFHEFLHWIEVSEIREIWSLRILYKSHELYEFKNSREEGSIDCEILKYIEEGDCSKNFLSVYYKKLVWEGIQRSKQLSLDFGDFLSWALG